MGLHADAHHGHLANVGIHIEGVVAQHVLLVEQRVLHLLDGGLRHSEGDVRSTHGRTGLHNHVHIHAGGGQLGKHLGGHAWLVRHAAHGGQRLRTVVGDAGNHRSFRAQVGEQVAHGFRFFFSHVLPCLA